MFVLCLYCILLNSRHSSKDSHRPGCGLLHCPVVSSSTILTGVRMQLRPASMPVRIAPRDTGYNLFPLTSCCAAATPVGLLGSAPARSLPQIQVPRLACPPACPPPTLIHLHSVPLHSPTLSFPYYFGAEDVSSLMSQHTSCMGSDSL